MATIGYRPANQLHWLWPKTYPSFIYRKNYGLSVDLGLKELRQKGKYPCAEYARHIDKCFLANTCGLLECAIYGYSFCLLIWN